MTTREAVTASWAGLTLLAASLGPLATLAAAEPADLESIGEAPCKYNVPVAVWVGIDELRFALPTGKGAIDASLKERSS